MTCEFRYTRGGRSPEAAGAPLVGATIGRTGILPVILGKTGTRLSPTHDRG